MRSFDHRLIFRMFLVSFVIIFIIILVSSYHLLGQNTIVKANFEYSNVELENIQRLEEPISGKVETDIKIPIILWWTPFTGEPGRAKKCGDVECFFTNNRIFRDHPSLKVFMFYGTEFKPHDLPLPRQPHHEWALFHEESPKNIYLFSFEEIMALFNHTCTYKRQSDYPITTQYLKSISSLESKEFLVPTKEKSRLQSNLAPVVYVHSDCNPPSNRDYLVKQLMKYIPVDSYGKCVHNKDLPAHLVDPIRGMNHADFLKIMAQYKFTLSIENAVCDDYITEKLWRTFEVGSIPIIYGSPKIRDFLPSHESAILLKDFKTIKQLAQHIKYLNSNDVEYDKYLEYKNTGIKNMLLKETMKFREWGINNDPTKINFIDGFECFVCKRLHKNMQLQNAKKDVNVHRATKEHYGCPMPEQFNKDGSLGTHTNKWYAQEYLHAKYVAKVLTRSMQIGVYNLTEEQFSEKAFQYLQNNEFKLS